MKSESPFLRMVRWSGAVMSMRILSSLWIYISPVSLEVSLTTAVNLTCSILAVRERKPWAERSMSVRIPSSVRGAVCAELRGAKDSARRIADAKQTEKNFKRLPRWDGVFGMPIAHGNPNIGKEMRGRGDWVRAVFCARRLGGSGVVEISGERQHRR